MLNYSTLKARFKFIDNYGVYQWLNAKEPAAFAMKVIGRAKFALIVIQFQEQL